VCQRSGPLAGACTQCSATNAAACGGLKPTCLPALGICGCDAAAAAACGTDVGLVCNGPGGFCVPGCTADPGAGCPAGAACTNVTAGVGQCASSAEGGAGCATDASCAAPLPHCDVSVTGGRCVQCLGDGDCGAGLVCDPTTKVCVECAPGHAQACRADGTGSRCSTRGECGCADDTDCGAATSGRVCDATTGRCVPGCRGAGGNVCPDAQACSSSTSAVGQCQAPSLPDGGTSGDASTDAGASGGSGAGGTGGGLDASAGAGGSGLDASAGAGGAPDAAMDVAGSSGMAGAGGSSGGGAAGTSGGAAGTGASADGGPITVGPDGYLAGGGCHCDAGGAGGSRTSLAWLAALGLLAARRRRSRP
jgi:hypothetical protein